jgi:hypothetical protein
MITKNEYEKQIATSLKPLVREELDPEIAMCMNDLFNNTDNKYIMLLCNENRYYTIFHRTNNSVSVKSIGDKLLDFIFNDTYLKSLGDVKYIAVNDDHVEIWIEEMYYALFPCDTFIVNI